MKTNHSQARGTYLVKGFTLVELLVVIAIIASLAAMATPVIMKALTKSKIVTAKAMCVSLESAVDRFESDYNYLPFEGGTAPDEDTPTATPITSDGELMAVLAGVEEDVNFRGVKYFTTGEPSGSDGKYKDGMVIEGKTAKLYDVWGKAYYMLLDYDLDGEIAHPFESGDENNVFGKKVLIFSTGPEKKVPSSGATNKVLRLIPSNFIR